MAEISDEIDLDFIDWLRLVDDIIQKIAPGNTTDVMPTGTWAYWFSKDFTPAEAVHAYAGRRYWPVFTRMYELWEETHG